PGEPQAPRRRDPWAPPEDRADRRTPAQPPTNPAPPWGLPAYGAPAPPFAPAAPPFGPAGPFEGLPPAASVPPPPIAPDGPGPGQAPGQAYGPGPIPGQPYGPGLIPGQAHALGYPGYPTYPAYPGSGGPAPGWPYAAPPPSNGMGTAAMVLGILSLFLFCLYGIVSIVLGTLAVILGILGRKKVRQGLADNGGNALAGIITGAVGIAVGAVIVGLLAWVFIWGEDSESEEAEVDAQPYSATLSPAPGTDRP
ncbi:DUF4190 domain-containing protein, partial [Streptomyces sp. E11-3]|uniref:DUF4190 domain-containing protein n=1 Tax=Streptomyces sp. E11-3 TaxID=3110112 RepID=UPI00397EAFDC